MRFRTGMHFLALALLTWVLSCGAQPDTPRLQAVSPESTAFGTPERLLLSGSFAPDVAVDLGSEAPPSLENRFEVRIGSERAYAVRFRSRDALEATAPATLPPGRHDVTVTDAQGRASTLSGAFEVIDRGVHRLVFVTSMRAARPGEWTEPIRIELRDLSGQPAPTATPRVLRVISDSESGRFARLGQGEEAQRELEVTLAPGESGVDLRYRDTTPGYHTLESSCHELPPIAQTVAVGRLGPPTAVRFTRVPTSPLVAGEPVALTVDVLDSSGGPASLPATGIQLTLRTNSPAGGLAVSESDPSHPALTLVLQGSQGRLPLLYKDTRSAAEVWLSASGFNRDTYGALSPHTVSLAVRPGATQRFEVLRTGTGPLQAGVPERFILTSLDAWNNRTPYTGTVRLDTSPPDPGFSPGDVELEVGMAAFNAEFSRVQRVSVVAEDPHAANVRGATPELTIQAGPPTHLAVSPVVGPQLAGEAFLLTLEALDRFGNRADTPLSVTLSASGVPEGALSPTTSGTFTGAITFPVMLTAAVEETRINLVEGTVSEPGALRTTTGGFAVLPGATQRFVVEDTPGAQTAGVPFRVRIRAVDTYGNTTRDVHELELDAQGVHAHQFSPARYTGFQGQADVELTVLLALSSTRLSVVSGNAKGQQPGTFAVNPGAVARFQPQVPPCITASDRWKLTLQAVDNWNNAVTSYVGTARLALSPFGPLSPSTTPPFTGGTVTLPNVTLNDVAGREPQSCLELIITDSADARKTVSQCLNLQLSCPKRQ
ncbi:MAG TPA: hypothetical protein VFZ09_15995 [Archangium sp.]|uniref:hypothetical protein n=1 Tax=Archangium sp. TaxID=1872627 RepID=UPI002E3539D5|nr:hypothetical protein [Archangium sp.]HEX5747750.1 hypothetical protein [Archangium sp.]